MDFGFVPPEQLPFVNFELPADTPLTVKVLNKELKDPKPELFVGCAKWGRKEWVGMIYPEKTKEANFLDEYVKHFNSIELNAVFYKMPEREQIRKWKEKAGQQKLNFKFCPKFTRTISHIKRLNNADDDTTTYLKSIAEFGNYLGPAFLQLGDNFGPKNLEILQDYLQKLPVDFETFVEVRHPEFYSNESARNEYFELLHKLNRGAVITDASGRRDCVHMEQPTRSAFIRFVGNGLHPTDYERIDAWVERLSDWSKRGLESVYFFLHQHDEKDTPVLADYTVKKFNAALGTSVELPKFI